MFGIVGKDGGFIDVSRSLTGAKISATRRGYKSIYKRSETSWQCWPVAYKVCGEWLSPEHLKNQRFYRFDCPLDARYCASLEFKCGDRLGESVYSYLIYFCGEVIQGLEADTCVEAIQLMQEHNAGRMAAYN